MVADWQKLILDCLSNIMKTTVIIISYNHIIIIISSFSVYTGAWPGFIWGFTNIRQLRVYYVFLVFPPSLLQQNYSQLMLRCSLFSVILIQRGPLPLPRKWMPTMYNRSYNRSCAWKPPITQIDTSYFTCARKKLLKVNILVQAHWSRSFKILCSDWPRLEDLKFTTLVS